MKKNIVQIDNFVPQKDQKIVLDTNILINLFYPINFPIEMCAMNCMREY